MTTVKLKILHVSEVSHVNARTLVADFYTIQNHEHRLN